MKILRPTKIELEGRGSLTLRLADLLATGGEASIYRRGDTIIKLYTDLGKMVRDGMVARIALLSAFNHPFVVAPRGVVYDGRGAPIGLYMDYAAGEALSRVFTNDFRLRTGFDDLRASRLVDGMFQVMAFAHGHKATLVDPNELNWTTVKNGDTWDPRVFDVDSWLPEGVATPQTVPMMPSIRDWQNRRIGPETDRFALAVVTFQVYTGIHPFKGVHPDYKPAELARRMQDRVSVFAPGVRLNRAVRDFACIPVPLCDWYRATFQDGSRTEPPSPFATGVTVPSRRVRVARTLVSAGSTLHYEKLYERPGDAVTRIFPCGVVRLNSGALVDLRLGRVIAEGCGPEVEVVRTADGWLTAELAAGSWRFQCINGTSLEVLPLVLPVSSQRVVRSGNRLFALGERGLTELVLRVFARPILAPGQTWGAMDNATRWFDEVGVQDAFGATYLIAPFGQAACAQARVRELDGLRVVAAKATNRFVAVIGVDKRGDYHKVELAFDRAYQSYTVWQGPADGPELNLAVTGRGVAATIVRDGELVVFVPSSGAVNRVADKDVTTDMVLGSWDDRVVYLRDGAAWSVRMS